MNLRQRIISLILIVLVGIVMLTAAVLTWNARESLLRQQRSSGEVIARMLARASYIVRDLPNQMENGVAEQMVTEATITAHFIAAAEAAGWTPEEINEHLKSIIASTSLSEFRITDETGHIYLKNQPNTPDFVFGPDKAQDPLYQLLTGKSKVAIQPVVTRVQDGKIFKYVAVAGIDKPRIVQVGFEATALNLMRQRVSLERLGQELVESKDIRAIRIVNGAIQTGVFQAAPDVDKNLSAQDLLVIRQVIDQGKSQAYMDQDMLKVVEPIRGVDATGYLNNTISGAVIIFLPTDQLQAAILLQLTQAIAVAVIILAAGIFMSLIFVRTITRPIDRFREAATSVQAGDYQPELLERVVKRTDELGRLGQVFDQMAREMGARDRRLRLLQVIIPLGVALSAEKDFSRLLETIVIEALKIAHADAGSLYLLDEGNLLKFVIIRNETLGVALGGTTGKEINLKPIPLYDEDGTPNHNHIVSYSALTGKHVWIDDAYDTTDFDLSGTRGYDVQTGYHTTSMLTISLKDTSNNIIGALQLLNAQDPKTHEVIPFEQDEVVDSLALITSAALSAYIREEQLREEIQKLRIEIDYSKQTKQVKEIVESDYFKALQTQADEMRKRRKGL